METPPENAARLETPGPDRLVAVAAFARLPEAEERGLVILAMGHSYWLIPGPDGYALCVEPAEAPGVRAELDRFEAEQARWPPRPPPDREPDGRYAGGLVAFGALLLLVQAADHRSGGLLTASGRMDASALLSGGEWWRAVTALTLHGSWPHLLANLASGSFFGAFASRRFGAGLAWLLMLAAGAIGNAATAFVYRGAGHLSVGASTAVFAALGMLGGQALAPRPAADAPAAAGRPVLLPLASAVVILAWLGAGDARTDVMAHLMGFLAGVPAGALAGRSARPPSPLVQECCALGALAIVAAAWFAALR